MRATAVLSVTVLLLFSNACQGVRDGKANPNLMPPQSTEKGPMIPLGQIAGAPGRVVADMATANPYQDNLEAIKDGKQLYVSMNCAGCHAYNLKGNMGPDLTDTYWRYGGLPSQIYTSIRDGRPQGMPSWGTALTPPEIWKVVAYIQSFGGSLPVDQSAHARQGDQVGEQVAPEAHP